VNRIVSEAYGILSLYVLMEPLSKVIIGVITGLGKQGTASLVTLLGYWVFGIPMTIAYVKWHGNRSLFGIWLGANASQIFILMFQYMIVHGADYEEITREVEMRRAREDSHSSK